MRWIWFGCACALWLVGPRALAQEAAPEEAEGAPSPEPAPAVDAAPDDPVVHAREEFALGVACMNEHETRRALEHFRAALALHDAPTIRYNLASALFELGRYPETARLVESVLGDEATSQEIREHATAMQQELLQAAGMLEIRVSGARQDAELRVDGEAVATERPVPVTPGAHSVLLIHDGEILAQQEVTARAGETSPVELVVLPPPQAVAEETIAPGPVEGGELWDDWPFWALIGTGVAVVVAAVVIGVVVANAAATTEEPVVGDYQPGLLRW
jgi:hypothetical protein